MYYSESDKERALRVETDETVSPENYRTPWRRDYARLIHSASFRRLQGKTQLFPGKESDFFRNRLTHSLEVAQIAKSIATKINHDLESAGENYRIEPDVVKFAGLAHDLDHPPFGHFGEEILNKMMLGYGGFEGNAQTLRLITRIEKKHRIDSRRDVDITPSGSDKRVGLNVTARSVASILKYDRQIVSRAGERRQAKLAKGYYASEKDVVGWVKKSVCKGKWYSGQFKTIECQIMDIADDIAYSTYDLEDSFKAGFLEPIDLLCSSPELLTNVAKKVSSAVGVKVSKEDVRDEIATRILFDVFKLPAGMEATTSTPVPNKSRTLVGPIMGTIR